MTTQSKRFLGVQLSDGVGGWNMSTFYLTCVAAILLGTFVNAFQPFLFTEIMAIPSERHGVVAGQLNFAGEIAIIVSAALAGALSDKLGRKVVMVAGFVLVALSLYLYPHAGSVPELLGYRVIYGVGIAAVTCMIVVLLADYAQDVSRGKAAGFQGVCNGIGAVIALFVLLRLPAIFQNNGMAVIESGVMTYYLVVGLTLLLALLSFFGLKTHVKATQHDSLAVRELVLIGLKEGRKPGIALAYAAAFVSRANLTIVGAFMPLWLANYGTEMAGMNSADALKKAGGIVAIAQGVALMGAPFFGILTDKVNRVTALLIALAISFVGYCSTALISDPFGGAMIAVVILIGLGEIGGIITSGVWIAQQTNEQTRGAVIGIFNLSGAVGILISSVAGGFLFDHWRAAGPFVFVGLCALAVMIGGLLMRRRIVRQAEADTAITAAAQA